MKKKIVGLMVTIYGVLAVVSFCYFMIVGEIQLRKDCIDQKGLNVGISFGCDSLYRDAFYQSITQRMVIYGFMGAFFPYYLNK